MDPIKLRSSHDFSVTGCGFVHQHSIAETYPLHTHVDFFEFFYVISGKAIHYINGESQLLTKGSLVLIRPSDVHKYESFNQYNFELVSVGFSTNQFYDICKSLNIRPETFTDSFLPPAVVLDGYNFSDIERKLLHIGKHTQPDKRKIYFSAIAPFLMYRINVPDAVQQAETMPFWLRDLLEEMNIKANFVEGLPKMVSLSCISQEHLTREFRKYIHMTPTEFINLKRMNYAAELLLNQQLDIIDICFECGFNNLSHFYHIFKKIYNCSPKRFIQNHLNFEEKQ